MIENKKPGIIVYIKVPKIGFVKTRLVSEFITQTQAYEIQKAMIKDTLQTLATLEKRFQPIISYYPENRVEELKDMIQSFANVLTESFIKKIQYIAQEGGSNGLHFASTFSKVFQLKNVNSCIIIGGDTPHLTKKIIVQALEWLTTAERSALIGPSQKGGFYIFGINKNMDKLETIFSKKNEFGNLLALSSDQKFSIKLLPFVFDIDTVDDVVSLYELSRGIKENKKKIVNKDEIALASFTTEYLSKNVFNNNYF